MDELEKVNAKKRNAFGVVTTNRPSAHVHMCESSSLSVHGVALDVSRWRDPSVQEVAAMLLEAAPHLLPSHADAISGEAPSREASRGTTRAPHTPPQSLAGSPRAARAVPRTPRAAARG